MGLTGDDDALRGSFAARDLAERVMIEAAQQAALEKRDPARMLRVLALLASPVYDPDNPEKAPAHLDLRAEWHFLAQGVRESKAPILLARLGLATLPALRSALSPRAAEQSAFPHVLHFSGHAWKGGLVFEDELGQVHLAGTAEVVEALKDMPQKIDLVVLNGCESAAEAHSVAQALLDRGLARAVVGHERSVLDSEAVAFAARLYAELCGGFTLKRALDNARKEITTHKVILLGDEELRFEGLCGGDPMIDERRQKGSLLPQAKLFLGRGRELVEMARALAGPPAAIIISGPPGIGKSSLLLEAALRSGWRFPGGVAYAAGPRPEEAEAATAQDLVSSLAGSLDLGNAEDLFSYTAMQPTLLLLDNLDSLAGDEQIRLRELLRRLGGESAAILALRPSSEALEDLPSAVPIQLHQGLALREATEYARFQAVQRKIDLPAEKAWAIAVAVGGHPRLLEQIVAQARRQDLDGLLEDVAKRGGSFADKIEEVYSWCAERLDPEGEAAWRAMLLFPAGSAPEAVLKAAAGEDGPGKLQDAALADFDSAWQLWRWHATVAEYARSHWPLAPDEISSRRMQLLPAWERWLKRLPADEPRTHSRLEGSRINLEAAAEECAGCSHQEAWGFLESLDERLPLPERTLTLRELVAKVWKAKLLLLPPEEMVERAKLLNNLGNARSNLGRREEALASTEKAADIYRGLAEANPQTFLPDLAKTLSNLGIRLYYQGAREKALDAAQEAVDIQRKLDEANPKAFLPGMATSLDTLASILSVLGRKEKALDLAQEAVAINEHLAGSDPQIFLPHLAMSLHNLGLRLSELNQKKEALDTVQRVVDIHRQLVSSDSKAFLPDLAASLTNLGGRLSDLGMQKEALAAAQESVDIRRRLAKSNSLAFLPDLATSLNNLGKTLSSMRQPEEALAATKESVAIRRRLTESNPKAFLPDLAMSLNNFSLGLSGLGRQKDALAAAEEAVAIRRELTESNPQEYLSDLATSLQNQALILYALGRREEALEAAREAADIRGTLAKENPQAFLPDLARSLGVYGNVLLGMERYGEAVLAFSEGLRLLAPFFQELPQVFGGLASALKRLYLDACRKAGAEPDGDLLKRFN